MADPSMVPYTPNPNNPANVADLFAQDEKADIAASFIAELDGLDPSLKSAIAASIADNKSGRDDVIADAIRVDSEANGSPIPEVIARTMLDGSIALYTFNPDGPSGKRLILVETKLDQAIPLPKPPAPSDNPPAPSDNPPAPSDNPPAPTGP